MGISNDGLIHGLDELKIGETILGYIHEDGIDWGGDEPTTQKIYSAQGTGSAIIELADNPGSDELSFKLLQLDPTNLSIVMGGSVQVNKWLSAKKKQPIISKAQITTKDETVIKIGKVSLLAFFRGKITGKELLTAHCKMTILDDGTENPVAIEYPSAG